MPESPSYRALLRLPGIPALLVGSLCARTAYSMLTVGLVLFVLRDYGSPTLAGLATFAWTFPGLLTSPLAGALLDRHGRIRLIVLDYTVQVFAFCLLGALSLTGRLPPVALVLIVGLASFTQVMSTSGGRSLFPLLVPRPLWERGNALDSQGYVLSSLLGPPLAGLLVGVVGGAWTLIVATGVLAVGALAMRQVPDPRASAPSGPLLRNALAGLSYVARSRSLRGIAIAVSIHNFGYGVFLIALPVLVLTRLHQPPVAVGGCYAITGLVGIGAGLLAGRLRTEGRERQIMAAGFTVDVLALLLLPWATSLWVVLLASGILGLSGGPTDIAMFTLRQRRTDPAWYGRAFAVSLAFNYAGQPLGSAAAGPLITLSLTGTLLLVVAIKIVAAALPLVAIPAREPDPVPG